MRIQFSLPFLPLFLGISVVASAQKLLESNLSKRCIFHSSAQEEELYSFEGEYRDVQQLVTDILQRGGDLEQNFTLIQANVENVSAVVDSQNRYILWSLDFWENATPLMRLASFAHMIGHHVNLHRLTHEYRLIEEPEADVFMGYILGMKNVPPRIVSVEPESVGIFDAFTYEDTSGYDRVSTVLQGHAKTEKALKIESMAFENDPSWADFQKAAFPFPPPQCYQSTELQFSSFAGAKTLGDVGKKIAWVFEQKGYPFRFMSVPDGFALVTQLEQYQEDGSIQADRLTRWKELPEAESFSLSLSYLKSLVFPRKAHLRVFAVLVTQRSYPSNQAHVSKEDAKAWISQGVNRLPKTVAEKPFSSNYSVDVLVYEFEVPETTFKPWQHCPCHLTAREHLQKTGLDAWLR